MSRTGSMIASGYESNRIVTNVSQEGYRWVHPPDFVCNITELRFTLSHLCLDI
jgi:hypothetical protein